MAKDHTPTGTVTQIQGVEVEIIARAILSLLAKNDTQERFDILTTALSILVEVCILPEARILALDGMCKAMKKNVEQGLKPKPVSLHKSGRG